jgi:hypothetical protein
VAKRKVERVAIRAAAKREHLRRAREDRLRVFSVQWGDGAWIDVAQDKPLKNVCMPDRADRGYLRLRFVRASRGNVVRGLDLGVQQMSLGEVAAIKSRFDFSYGHYVIGGGGATPIPPRANLIFTTQLLSINGKRLPPPPVRFCTYSYRFLRRLVNRCCTLHRHRRRKREQYSLLRQRERQRAAEANARRRRRRPLPPVYTAAGLQARAVGLLRWLRVLAPEPDEDDDEEEDDEEYDEEDYDDDDYDDDEEDDDDDDDEYFHALAREMDEEDERSLAGSEVPEAVAELSVEARRRQRYRDLKKLRTPATKMGAKVLFGSPAPRAPLRLKGKDKGKRQRGQRRDDDSNSFLSSSVSGSGRQSSSWATQSRRPSEDGSGSGSGSAGGREREARDALNRSPGSSPGGSPGGSQYSPSPVPPLRAHRVSISNFDTLSDLGDVSKPNSHREEK